MALSKEGNEKEQMKHTMNKPDMRDLPEVGGKDAPSFGDGVLEGGV